MDFKFFQLVLKRCKGHYLKMFTLGLGVILLICIAFLLLYLDDAFEPLSLILVFFGALPLLLSYELVCSRLFTDHDVNYNEIYKNYKAYFAPIFRGCFSVISSVFIALFVNILLESFFISANIDLHSLERTNYINSLFADGSIFSENMVMIMQSESFYYFQILSLGIAGLIFIYRIISRMTIPYFSFFLGIPSLATKKIIKQIKTNRTLDYKKQSFTNAVPFLLIYLLVYFLISYLIFYFLKDLSLALLLGFGLSLLSCSFYLPIYVAGCYELFQQYRLNSFSYIKNMLENDLTRILNDSRINEEQKNKIKDGLDSYKQKLDEASNNKEEDKKEQ